MSQPNVPATYTNYEVLYDGNRGRLADYVNSFLAEGYVPIGGVCSSPEGWYQAVARPVLPSVEILLDGVEIKTQITTTRVVPNQEKDNG